MTLRWLVGFLLNRGRSVACLFYMVALFVPSSLQALSPDVHLSQVIHEQWQTEKGLPQNSINTLIQDRTGYIWFGTDSGLVRFDGVHFQVFDDKYFHGAFHNYVFELLEASDGCLWVGTRGGGVYCISGGKIVQHLGLNEGLPSEHVWSMAEGKDESLWIGTRDGLARYLNGKLTIYKKEHGLPAEQVNAIYIDKAGTLWMGTSNGGFVSFDGAHFKSYDTSQFQSDIKAIVPKPDGGLWVGFDGEGVWAFENGKFSALDLKLDRANINVQALLLDRAGMLWIGTQHHGFLRYGHGTIEDYSMAEGLSCDHVSCLFECREDTIWVGTINGGLNRFKEGKTRPFGVKEGLMGEDATCVSEAPDGALYVGTMDHGLFTFKNGLFTNIFLGQYARKSIRALSLSSQRGLWIGTADGVADITKGRRTFYTQEDNLPHTEISVLLVDHSSRLWVGTPSGLCVSTSSSNDQSEIQFTRRTEPELQDNIRALAEGADGVVWVGTHHNGIFALKENSIQRLLPETFPDITVRCLYSDKEGALWIGTRNNGLFRYKDGTLFNFTTQHGLVNNQVSQILESDGDFWLTTNRGIERIAKSQLDRVAQQGGTFHPELLDEGDGMRISECSADGSPAGCRTADGKLWIPTARGVVMINPASMPANTNPPPVVITDIYVNGEKREFEDLQKLAPGAVRFEIDYTALSLRAPGKVQFAYKLDGEDKTWVEAGFKREASYRNLKPGHYAFHVKARNEDGIWSTKEATLAFYLAPYFYQTGWFYFLSALSIGLTARGFYLWRLQQVASQTERLKRMVAEQTVDLHKLPHRILQAQETERRRLARELHDSVKQILTQVDFRIGVASAQATSGSDKWNESLRAAQRMLQSAVNELTRIAWNLRPSELDDLSFNDALSRTVREFHESTGIEVETCTIELPPLPKATELNLYRIVQESLANIQKHSHATSVSIIFKMSDTDLIVEIRDNGIGFNPSTRGQHSSGMGLLNMKERAMAISANLSIHGHPGDGVRITIALPLNSLFRPGKAPVALNHE
jgi:signal transduction histidine kinase/ligand-binding sensor domain-containing protein